MRFSLSHSRTELAAEVLTRACNAVKDGYPTVTPKATQQAEEPLTFKSQLALKIWRQVSAPPPVQREQKSEWFLPGRLWLGFNLTADGSDMPMITHYSKEDCPTVAERHTDLLPDALMSKLKDIMTLVRQVTLQAYDVSLLSCHSPLTTGPTLVLTGPP